MAVLTAQLQACTYVRTAQEGPDTIRYPGLLAHYAIAVSLSEVNLITCWDQRPSEVTQLPEDSQVSPL